MPEKLHNCVRDVKKTGKSEDSAWAICNDSIKEEVGTAIGIVGVKEELPADIIKEVSTALGIAGVGMQEDHHPLDSSGYEAPDPPLYESVSIPSSASAVSIGGKKKVEETIVKQLLETQLGECPCKNKNRPKA